MTSPPEPEPGTSIVEELRASFRRLRPQGTPPWNFLDAYARLARQYPEGSRLDERAAEPPGSGGAGMLRRRLARLRRLGRADPLEKLGARMDANDTRVAEAFDATREAFRFLSIRLDRLEETDARRRAPLQGMAWLEDLPDLGPWEGPIVDYVGAAARPGPVVHAECGTGRLVAALERAGLAAIGVEPRGALAWQAARAGVTVLVGTAAEHLGAGGSSSLGGLVLSGGVDRLEVDDVPVLLGLAADRLAPGAPLVLVVAEPGRRNTVAADLLPNELHPDTWGVFLDRHGFEHLGRLAPDRPGPADLVALAGRRSGER